MPGKYRMGFARFFLSGWGVNVVRILDDFYVIPKELIRKPEVGVCQLIFEEILFIGKFEQMLFYGVRRGKVHISLPDNDQGCLQLRYVVIKQESIFERKFDILVLNFDRLNSFNPVRRDLDHIQRCDVAHYVLFLNLPEVIQLKEAQTPGFDDDRIGILEKGLNVYFGFIF